MIALAHDDDEHPVPEALRPVFRQIAYAFVQGDYFLREHPVEGVRLIDPTTAQFISDMVSAYGETLAPLDDATWERSCYRYMGSYWEFLVDITTEDEIVSDLTLHAKVRLIPQLLVEVWSVHVP